MNLKNISNLTIELGAFLNTFKSDKFSNGYDEWKEFKNKGYSDEELYIVGKAYEHRGLIKECSKFEADCNPYYCVILILR